MELSVLKSHLATIASDCDHAHERDGIGFSKTTATMGHLLNSIDDEDFTSEMIDAATFLIHFHRKQLGLKPKDFENKPSGKLREHTEKNVLTTLFVKDGVYKVWTSKKFPQNRELINGFASTTHLLNKVPFPEGEMFEFASIDAVALFYKIYASTILDGNTLGANLEVNGDNLVVANVNGSEVATGVLGTDSFHVIPDEYLECAEPIYVHENINNFLSLTSQHFANGFNDGLGLINSEKLTVVARQTKKYLYFDIMVTNEDAHKLLTELRDQCPLFMLECLEKGSQGYAHMFTTVSIKSGDFSYKGAEKLANALNLSLDLTYAEPVEFLPYIEVERKKQRRYFEFTDAGRLKVFFPYSSILVSMMRGFKSRTFVGGDTPYWQVTIDKDSFICDNETVVELMDEHNFIFEQKSPYDTAIEKFKKESIDNPPAPPTLISLLDDGSFTIKFDFDYERLSLVKDSFKSTYRNFDRPSSTWHIQANKYTKVALLNFKEAGWNFNFDIDAYLTDTEEESNNRLKQKSVLKKLSKAKKVAKTNKVYKKSLLSNALMKFQYVPVSYSDYTERFFMADDMGTGKTVQALAIVEYKGYTNTLVLCPNIASPTWEREILKFYPNISKSDILRIKTVDQKFSKEDLLAAKFTVVHYDILHKLSERLTEEKVFDSIVADESHKIKNKDSLRSEAAFLLNEVHQPKGKLLLSGSITTGKPKDLIAQLEFLGMLDEEFGGFFEFTTRYCNGHRNEFGFWDYTGASNLPELYNRLAETCMVRRKKTDVLKDLPTKLRSCISVELSNAKEYQQLEKEAVDDLVQEFKKYANISLKNHKSKLNDEGLSSFDEDAYLKAVIAEKLARYNAGGLLSQGSLLKSVAAKGKVKPAVEWIKNYLDNDVRAPLVVFPNSRLAQADIFDAVKSIKGVKVLKITATHKADERAKIIEEFQSGECDVLVASLKATNTNVTLTAASTCLFPDLTDEADGFIQAEDRILRIGATGDSVECVYLKADDTIDEDIWDRHCQKISNIALVQDGKISKEFDMRPLASRYTQALISRVSTALKDDGLSA